MVMRFKDMMMGRRKTGTKYFGDLEAETTQTEDVDNRVYLLSKASRVVIALAVIQTARQPKFCASETCHRLRSWHNVKLWFMMYMYSRIS